MTDWLTEFPFNISIDLDAIDKSVIAFSKKFDFVFSAIKGGLDTMISGIYTVLDIIPWWLLVAAVFYAGWLVSKKIKTAVIYSVMLMFIGMVGYWDLMNQTLSIVISAVIISIFFGFIIGVLISSSDRADRIVRPILDTMQTMPVFVYLIPAVVFFGLGKAPAVLATTIYAIVPIIRLTGHGIRQVDKEVVEAAKAFGSTRMQTLMKVQIPQALPTIMAGVNQTLMMAMAMVVTCSMIGASGLGMEVLFAVNRQKMGLGLVSGASVVIIAILIDRLTQGCINKSEVKKYG